MSKINDRQKPMPLDQYRSVRASIKFLKTLERFPAPDYLTGLERGLIARQNELQDPNHEILFKEYLDKNFINHLSLGYVHALLLPYKDIMLQMQWHLNQVDA